MGYYKNMTVKGGRPRPGPVTVEFTGAENIEQIFSQIPEVYAKKPVIATFRKAAATLIKAIRAKTPAKTNDTRRSVGIVTLKNQTGIAAGFRSGKKYMPTYTKAYWHNYGTLQGRDTAHQFGKPLSGKRQGRGIKALLFVESAWTETRDQVRQNIENNLEEQTRKFLQKHAAK